jgi:hypothetical protein
MSELNAFIDKYILELEQIRDEVKTFKEHAVEVLFKYISRHHEMTEEKEKSMRAEAKQLLGVQ